MAGKLCPHCGKHTFFESPTGRVCSKCGYTMKVPPHEGTGGRGRKCPNCGAYKVRNDKCTGCGATFSLPG